MAQLIHKSGKKIKLQKAWKINFKEIKDARTNLLRYKKAGARKPVYTSAIKKWAARKGLSHDENLLIGTAILKMKESRRRALIHGIGYMAGLTSESAARNAYKDLYNKAKRTALLVVRKARGKKV